MANSMATQLQEEMVCEGLLECLHGHTQLDTTCYRVLVESDEPLTIDEVAELVDRERSTVYRSIQRLLQSGFVQKEQVNYEQGGYYHVYFSTPPAQIARDMQRTVNDWYAKMDRLIGVFEEKYDHASDSTAAIE
ncbi:helix-turn-helix domain-containing protein [Natronorubrum sulfidifaciens]|uniref:Transcriptional regulator, TrmB n=1 Tax=Natronorubrum sulfidifaciens JCM 14089 TaxID=1230460 RepID=L9W3P6_9EURY|nr:helix-turn-helix domain-containing protein [Natronorubrum sulfidifaciens]ELY44060.1 transcriptional regulator, TrmB [Natronorubrum sulfidifaciens JCM 14089]